MTTIDTASTKQNLELIIAMERQNIELAKEKGFKAIFTTNTSDATRVSRKLESIY